MSAEVGPVFWLPDITLSCQISGFLAQHSDQYVQAILDGEVERVRSAIPGTRNHALNTAGFIMGQLIGSGEITEEHA